MAKYKHEYKAPNLDYKEGETDAQYYKRLAKQADQRLVRIEELSGLRGKPPVAGYEEAYKYAYRKALDMLDQGTRFNANIPKPGTFEWRERVNAMREFLSSPTSTKSGIKQVYENRVNTLNDRYGTNFTWSELADFFHSGDFGKLRKQGYGSKVIMKAMGKIQQAQTDKLVDGMKQRRTAAPEDEVALHILRSRSLDVTKSMDPEEITKYRKLIRNL